MQSQNPDKGPAHSAHEHEMACQMMADHAAEVRMTSQTLSTNLAQMKATLPLINDINERSRWQSNIAMWQALADHFSHMAEHASHMQEMDCKGSPQMHGEH